MEIEVTTEHGRVPVTVFTIQGDIDANTYDQLQVKAKQAIQEGVRFLLLDLSKVPYISSYGIRALSQIYTWLKEAVSSEKKASETGPDHKSGMSISPYLKLANPNPAVKNVLKASGMDLFLDILPDKKQAVASY